VLVGAVISAALLINVLALAPAFHHHGPVHDTHTCAICTFHATGTIAPAPAAQLPLPVAVAREAFPVAREHPRCAYPLTILVRGPPAVAAHLT
jgi:hypothetical protein